MKTADQFKSENSDWIESIISSCVDQMTFEKSMMSHQSDYFTDTLSLSRERCKDEALALEVKEYIESEVVRRLKLKS